MNIQAIWPNRLCRKWIGRLLLTALFLPFGSLAYGADTDEQVEEKRQALPLPVPSSKGQSLLIQRSGDAEEGTAQSPFVRAALEQSDAPILTLEDAFNLAWEQNLDLEIMQARLVQTRANAGKAWAALLPSISLQASWRRLDPVPEYDLSAFDRMGSILAEVANMICQADPENEICQVPPDDNGGGGLGIEPLQNTYTGTLQINVPLVNVAGITGVRSANRFTESAELTTSYYRREVLFGVSQAYYGVLMAREMVRIATQTVATRQAHLQVAQAKVAVGDQPQVAALRAEIQVVIAQRDLEQARAGYQNAKNSLRNVLRLEGDFQVVRPQVPELGEEDQDQFIRVALQEREDISSARVRIEAAQLSLQASYHGYIPTIMASSNLMVDNAAQTRGADHPFNSVLMVVANLPLYQGGLQIREIEERRAALLEAELTLQQLSERVATDVRRVFNDLQTSKVAAVASGRQVELARENLRLILASFDAGMATAVDVVDADTGLYAAEISALRDDLAQEMSIMSLSRVVGQFPPEI